MSGPVTVLFQKVLCRTMYSDLKYTQLNGIEVVDSNVKVLYFYMILM